MHDQVHNRWDSVNERQPPEVDPIVLCAFDARTNNLPYGSADAIGASRRFSGFAIAEGRAARLTSTWWSIASACANNEIWRWRFAAVQRHPRFGSQRAAEPHGKTMNHPPRVPWGLFRTLSFWPPSQWSRATRNMPRRSPATSAQLECWSLNWSGKTDLKRSSLYSLVALASVACRHS